MRPMPDGKRRVPRVPLQGPSESCVSVRCHGITHTAIDSIGSVRLASCLTRGDHCTGNVKVELTVPLKSPCSEPSRAMLRAEGCEMPSSSEILRTRVMSANDPSPWSGMGPALDKGSSSNGIVIRSPGRMCCGPCATCGRRLWTIRSEDSLRLVCVVQSTRPAPGAAPARG